MKTLQDFFTYTKFLNEAPNHLDGNAPFEDDIENNRVGDISKGGIERDYKLLKDNFFKNFSLYKNTTGNYYCIGDWYIDDISKKERFGVISDVSFRHTKLRTKQKQLQNKNIIEIDIVHTTRTWRNNGISSKLYKYLLDEGYTIMSDSIQYDGAVKLWQGFTTVPNTVIWIYNKKEDKIISKYTEKTPYPSVWSDNDDDSKANIRLVFSNK